MQDTVCVRARVFHDMLWLRATNRRDQKTAPVMSLARSSVNNSPSKTIADLARNVKQVL